MASLLPKVKLFVLLSLFQIIINIGVILYQTILSGNFDIISFFAIIGSSFLPVTSVIALVLSGLPVEVIAFAGIFTGIISAFQIYLIAEIVLSHIPFVDV